MEFPEKPGEVEGSVEVQVQVVQVVIVEYQRTPSSFRDALRQSRVLAECRQKLVDAGQPCLLGRGANLFVRPEHSALVIQHLQVSGALFLGSTKPPKRLFEDDLKPRHVIFSSEFQYAVEAAIAARRGSGKDGGIGKENVRPRSIAKFTLAVELESTASGCNKITSGGAAGPGASTGYIRRGWCNGSTGWVRCGWCNAWGYELYVPPGLDHPLCDPCFDRFIEGEGPPVPNGISRAAGLIERWFPVLDGGSSAIVASFLVDFYAR